MNKSTLQHNILQHILLTLIIDNEKHYLITEIILSVTKFVLYIFFITLAEIFAMPFMMQYTLARAHKDRQGQYSALYSIGYGISFIIAPALGLYLAQHFGFVASFGIFIGLSGLVAVGFYRLAR